MQRQILLVTAGILLSVLPVSSGPVDSIQSNPAQTLASDEESGEGEVVYDAWVEFWDKGIQLEEHRRQFLTELENSFNPRALERRKKRRTLPGLFDERDLPVVDRYLEGVAATGAELKAKSRWLNGVAIRATAEQIETIEALPYVTGVFNAHIPDPHGEYASPPEPASRIDRSRHPGAADVYGRSGVQIRQLGLDRLHQAGYTGRDVIIAIIDTGFDLDHLAFHHPDHPLHVMAEWDFIDNDGVTAPRPAEPPYLELHGTYVLGTMAAYMPGECIGSAYDASFILCKAEHDADEFLLEERWFVMALEYAESHGADVITSSCGLYTGYQQDQMDGKTTVMSQGWNLAVGNGIIGLQGVGNFGHDDDPGTSHLFPPADAFGIISCGAVTRDGTIAGFSSDGPTVDGRLKPEVLALGLGVWTVSMSDKEGFVTAAGTSMATPIMAGAVACLLQTRPGWTISELSEALFHSGDYYRRHGQPDSLYVHGFGIPDVYAAAGLKTP